MLTNRDAQFLSGVFKKVAAISTGTIVLAGINAIQGGTAVISVPGAIAGVIGVSASAYFLYQVEKKHP